MVNFNSSHYIQSSKINNFIIIVIAISAFIYGLSIGINLTNIPVFLSGLNFSKAEIAYILSVEIIAIFFTAPFLQKVINFLGFYNCILFSLVIRNFFLALLGLSSNKLYLICNNFLFGSGGYLLYTCFQILINQITNKNNRGLTFGLLNSAFALGIALGPLFLNILQITPGSNSIILSSLIATTMLIPLTAIKYDKPLIESASYFEFYNLLKIAQVPIMCGFIVDYAFFGFGDFIVLYGISKGLSKINAMLLITYMIMSSIILDIPIGWLIDKVNRNLMIIIFTLCAIICYQLIPYVILDTFYTIILFAFLSASVSGIYICGISLLGDKFHGEDLIAANSALSIMNAAGAFLGITITGIAISTWGDRGFIISLSVTFIMFLLFSIFSFIKK